MNISIFGAGYVGLVTGACFAELGHEVVLRDVLEDRIAVLDEGRMPIFEPGLEELVERNRKRMSFTLDVAEAIEGAEFLFIAVGTPPTYSGDADLSAVWTVIDELPRDLDVERPIVVMKSTVPVGTGASVRAALDARGLASVGYVSNPEFLAEGTAIAGFMRPDRIVVGAFEETDGDRVASLYAGLDAPIVRTSVPSAEMVKLASNAFLTTDVTDVATGVGLDHRLGPHFLRAGLGWGGSCFGKDVSALKQLAGNSGYHFQLLSAVIEVNELQKRRVVAKLQRRLGSLRGKKVALLGLAFKPGTDDMREAPSLVLAGRLLAEGADVTAWDPVADGRVLLHRVEIAGSALDALAGADAAVLVTEWPELRELDWSQAASRMRNRLVVDGRNMLDAAELRKLGFQYEGIGRQVE